MNLSERTEVMLKITRKGILFSFIKQVKTWLRLMLHTNKMYDLSITILRAISSPHCFIPQPM